MSARARAARARRRAFDPALLSEAARTFLGGDGSSHVLAYADVVGLARGERVNQRWRAEAARLRQRAEQAFREREDVDELLSYDEALLALRTISQQTETWLADSMQAIRYVVDDRVADRLAHNWEQGCGAQLSMDRRANSFASFINCMEAHNVRGRLLISAQSDDDVSIWFNAFRGLAWLREALPSDDAPRHDHYLVHQDEGRAMNVVICKHETLDRETDDDSDPLQAYGRIKWLVIDDGGILDPDTARRPWRILTHRLGETQYHMSALPHRGLELDELAFRFYFPSGHGSIKLRELLRRARYYGRLGSTIAPERRFILELLRRELEVLLTSRVTHIAAAPVD